MGAARIASFSATIKGETKENPSWNPSDIFTQATSQVPMEA